MIHPWMKGYVILRDTPYMAVSDEDGFLQLKNLPVGTHKVRFWHERVGWFRDVNYAGPKVDRRGCLEVEIEPGANEIPRFMVKPENLHAKKESKH
ncbi:MAG: hypothetical protein ACR2NZ_10085 [Rubripirellula sp.]